MWSKTTDLQTRGSDETLGARECTQVSVLN